MADDQLGDEDTQIASKVWWGAFGGSILMFVGGTIFWLLAGSYVGSGQPAMSFWHTVGLIGFASAAVLLGIAAGVDKLREEINDV